MSDETKEVAVQTSALPALPDKETIREVFHDNFEGVSFAFPVIKMPTGGTPIWSVPSDEGDPEMVKELIGTILDHYPVRAYWPDAFGGGNTPPTCASLDAKTGSLPRNENGEYGDCHTCKFAQWGSGKDGRGQQCKKIHRIFLWLAGKDSIFPHLIPLPPTSAEGRYEGSFSTYVVKLGGKMKKLSDVKTKVRLIQDTNKDGIKYAKSQFFFVEDITEEEKKNVAFLRENLKLAMRSKDFELGESSEVSKNGHSADNSSDPWDSK